MRTWESFTPTRHSTTRRSGVKAATRGACRVGVKDSQVRILAYIIDRVIREGKAIARPTVRQFVFTLFFEPTGAVRAVPCRAGSCVKKTVN